MMDDAYDADVDDYDYWYKDEYETYHKDEFLRWFYGKPQLDEYDIDYAYDAEED